MVRCGSGTRQLVIYCTLSPVAPRCRPWRSILTAPVCRRSSPERGLSTNNLVFDKRGRFYFTDFRGTSTDPRGGVYYVSPNFKTITAVLPHLSEANGVALSPDGKRLWATEFGRNLLHRIDLETATKAAVIGTAIPYHFTGAAPGSMRMDRARGRSTCPVAGPGSSRGRWIRRP